MLDVIILALALSMDAFAVSIGLGAKQNKSITRLALMAGIYFGAFQGMMPIVGYFGGKSVLLWIEIYAPWIAFILLLLIGLKMLYESFRDDDNKNTATITHKVMFVLAIATSIDAMAAGFALNVLAVDPLLACALIAITTFIFSLLGVYIGSKSGTWLESKAELLGGLTLIAIAFKILLF